MTLRLVEHGEAEPEKHDPHTSGQARCLGCKHEWVAVAPVGTYWLQCPHCSRNLGKYIFAFNFPDDLHWTCKCGNDLFYAMNDGYYCPNCGEIQKGF